MGRYRGIWHRFQVALYLLITDAFPAWQQPRRQDRICLRCTRGHEKTKSVEPETWGASAQLRVWGPKPKTLGFGGPKQGHPPCAKAAEWYKESCTWVGGLRKALLSPLMLNCGSYNWRRLWLDMIDSQLFARSILKSPEAFTISTARSATT